MYTYNIAEVIEKSFKKLIFCIKDFSDNCYHQVPPSIRDLDVNKTPPTAGISTSLLTVSCGISFLVKGL